MVVTLKHVAEKVGMSCQTVSKVLNGGGNLYRPETRQRVLLAALEMGYMPNAAARAMRSNKTNQIGVLIRNAPDRPFHYPDAYEMILGINQYLETQDYTLTLVRYNDVLKSHEQISRVFREHVLDGVIVLESFPNEVYQAIESLVPKCIWLDTNVWREENCIRRDEAQVGRLVGEKMLAMGYLRLIWCGRGDEESVDHASFRRYEGVRQVADAAGIKLEKCSLTRWKNKLPVALNPEILEMVLKPDCGLITDGKSAVHLLIQAAMFGMRPGFDFGLASCDMPYASLCAAPMMSHVTFDRFAMGQLATKMMFQRLHSSKTSCPSILMEGQWRAGSTAWGPQGKQKETL